LTGPPTFAVFKRRTADFPTFSHVLEVQDVRVDPQARRVWRAGREILLSRKEYDLLHALIARAGEIVSREDLMRDVWHTTFWTSSKTIDVHLGWVRRKLGDDSRRPVLISTIRGRGLRFETAAPVASVEV
jgi:DNA-binding response OmpR family regulator